MPQAGQAHKMCSSSSAKQTGIGGIRPYHGSLTAGDALPLDWGGERTRKSRCCTAHSATQHSDLVVRSLGLSARWVQGFSGVITHNMPLGGGGATSHAAKSFCFGFLPQVHVTMSRLSVHRCMHPVHSISKTFELLQWNHDCVHTQGKRVLRHGVLHLEPSVLHVESSP